MPADFVDWRFDRRWRLRRSRQRLSLTARGGEQSLIQVRPAMDLTGLKIGNFTFPIERVFMPALSHSRGTTGYVPAVSFFGVRLDSSATAPRPPRLDALKV